jgi:hypothetical protein
MRLIDETSVLPVNRPSNFEKLAKDIRRSLLDWIQANMVLTSKRSTHDTTAIP